MELHGKIGRFSGGLRLDCGNTTREAMAGLGIKKMKRKERLQSVL